MRRYRLVPGNRQKKSPTSLSALLALEPRLFLSGLPLSSVPVLNSNPGAPVQLYLDFVGAPGQSWYVTTAPASPAYDQDGDPTTFSSGELSSIREIFARVAEAFSPFNISVTTVAPAAYDGHQLEVIIGGNGSWAHNAGGVSWVGSFVGGPYSVYVFPANLGNGAPIYTADAICHESGHAFNLEHQSVYSGSTKTSEYNYGDSMTAPIMGVPYNAARALWWQGQSSLSSTTIQDDLAVLTSSYNLFGYRPDDHGNDPAHADPLAVSGATLTSSGIIEQMTDADYFSFTTPAGDVSFNVNVAPYGPMLHARLELHDAADNVIATAADPNSLGQTLSANLAAGTYYLVVKSYGQYGDLGQYTVSGTIPAGSPAPVANAGGPYTVSEGGSVALSAAASTGSNLTYAWDLDGDGIFGETGAAASNGDETGAAPTFRPVGLSGSTTAWLRVTDDGGRTSTSSANINITNVAPAVSINLLSQSAAISLGSTVSDPGPFDNFTYAWTVLKDGQPFASGTDPGISFIPNANGAYDATLSVTDADGATTTASRDITVDYYDALVPGTSADQQFYLRLDPTGASVEVHSGDSAAGAMLFTAPLAAMHSLTIDSAGGNDTITVDLGGGNPFSLNVIIDGGDGSDALLLKSAPSGQVFTASPLSIAGGPTISYANIEKLGYTDGAHDIATLPPGEGLVASGTAAINLTQSITLPSLDIAGSAAVTLAAGGANTLVISSATPGSLNFTLPPDTSSTQPFVGLDLNDNGMIVEAGNLADRNALLTTLSGLIQRSRNAFASSNVLWAGNGIRSATAAAEAAADTVGHTGLTGVAIAPNVVFNTTTGTETGTLHTTWKGQNGLDGNAVLVAYSYNGDADVDGNITFSDYAQANYGFLHGKSDYWWGNFDFSVPTPPATAAVTFDDYYLVNQTFLKEAAHRGPIPMAKVASPFSTKAVAAPSAAQAAPAPQRPGKRMHRGNVWGSRLRRGSGLL